MVKNAINSIFENEVKKTLAAVLDVQPEQLKGIDRIKDMYLENKGHLLSLFPESLRIEREISAQEAMDRESLLERIESLVRDQIYRGKAGILLQESLALALGREERRDTINDAVIDTIVNAIKVFDIQELVANRFSGRDTEVIFDINDSVVKHCYLTDRGKDSGYLRITIPAKTNQGMRVSKLISNLFRSHWKEIADFLQYLNDMDSERYMVHIDIESKKEEFMRVVDIVISKVIEFYKESDKVRVVLSIHPLDYLTQSCHTTGWRSCHNLFDGEYRTGTLDYMLDDVTIVTYAYSDSKMFVVNNQEIIPWPVKIWRQMAYLDLPGGHAVFSRQYRSDNDLFAKTVPKMVAELMARALGIDDAKYIRVHRQGAGRVNLETAGRWHYQDNYECRIYLDSVNQDKISRDIVTGVEYLPCPVCGNMRDREDEGDGATGYLTCCLDVVRCYHCGCSISSDDVFFDRDGDGYCRDCFDELFIECNECNAINPRDEVYWGYRYGEEVAVCHCCYHDNYSPCVNCEEVYYLDDNMTYVDSVDGYVCGCCLREHYVACDECGEYINEYDGLDIDNHSFCGPDCVEAYGYKECIECGEWFRAEDEVRCGDCQEEEEEKEEAV